MLFVREVAASFSFLMFWVFGRRRLLGCFKCVNFEHFIAVLLSNINIPWSFETHCFDIRFKVSIICACFTLLSIHPIQIFETPFVKCVYLKVFMIKLTSWYLYFMLIILVLKLCVLF
jgi:hypothetical protein